MLTARSVALLRPAAHADVVVQAVNFGYVTVIG
jgi:hypothetical protein